MGTLKSCRLKNGLICYINYDKRKKRSTGVCLVVKAGSAMEKEGQKGWFHFLEHLSAYSSLSVPESKTDKEKYFRAFEYSYTSFYETAYYFKAVDTTGVMLVNSLISVKHILDGNLLMDNAVPKTRKDVLDEWNSCRQKPGYSVYVKKLALMDLILPVGLPEDIDRIDYELIKKLHKAYYRMNNAAIIISSPLETDVVYQLIQQVFIRNFAIQYPFGILPKATLTDGGDYEKETAENRQLYRMAAWYPRRNLPGLENLEIQILHTVMAKGVEISLMSKKEIEIAVCCPEVFDEGNYLFQLSIVRKDKIAVADILHKIIRQITYSPELFELSKNVALACFRKECSPSGGPDMEEIIKRCREHFLFQEPVFLLKNEYDVKVELLNNLKYHTVKNGFDCIMEQFADFL